MASGPAPDPFDDLLNLEDRFYDEGFCQGEADGTRAGQIEGRTLGLENGFKKFVESGRLHGKAVVWANRLSLGQSQEERDRHQLPALPRNGRLQKNVRMLYALVEPGTLSTANTDEAVNDFDDRVKRAQSKARVVEKMLHELATPGTVSGPSSSAVSRERNASSTGTPPPSA
ncbi:DUF1715 domain-containing protein [Niveomyces insectorum RCEF 264]|uniref:DUF1715 domain-containing protein n=1 Tax=Niveomyces insectorum RCEF 264 TaxID=1081102 RepID=A0A167RUC5_9HYPO|nr:DUF1715 domain-containing protein [Niveomyces insectorum RCEF 264]